VAFDPHVPEIAGVIQLAIAPVFMLTAVGTVIGATIGADRAAGLLAIVGVVNLPIIHYSVYWWNTLHQGSTLTKLGKPSMTGDMLWPLLTMLLAFTLYFGAILLLRLRGEILLRERDASWLKTELAR